MRQSPKQIINNHKKIIAKMVHAFIVKASYKSPEEVLEIYKSFSNDWDRRVKKVNDREGVMILSYDVWEREWKESGYKKFITIPVPKQLPEAEKEKLIAAKKELIRLVFIIEGKTEHQRQRRELVYKTAFIIMRFKLWIKSLLKKKEVVVTTKMSVAR